MKQYGLGLIIQEDDDGGLHIMSIKVAPETPISVVGKGLEAASKDVAAMVVTYAEGIMAGLKEGECPVVDLDKLTMGDLRPTII